ncbi:MAG: hypothetical protein ACOYU3_05190 [Bacillota bacterium]
MPDGFRFPGGMRGGMRDGSRFRRFPRFFGFPFFFGFPRRRCFRIDRFGRCCDQWGRCWDDDDRWWSMDDDSMPVMVAMRDDSWYGVPLGWYDDDEDYD